MTAAARQAEHERAVQRAADIGLGPRWVDYSDPVEQRPTYAERLAEFEAGCPFRCAGDPRRSAWFDERGRDDPRAPRLTPGWPRTFARRED